MAYRIPPLNPYRDNLGAGSIMVCDPGSPLVADHGLNGAGQEHHTSPVTVHRPELS